MSSPSVWETLHATDETSMNLEDRQLDLGEGPTIDAFVHGGPVLVSDVDSPEARARWPIFVADASANGVRAMFALPVQVGAIRLGALNLHRSTPGSLNTDQISDALAFADAACALLLAEAEGGTHTGAADDIWHREDHSAHQGEVHQATGMVLVQLGVSAEIALSRLRAFAFRHGRPLGDVARDVVERRLRFNPDDEEAG
ncbi:GAF and ANTAR domain-containing protein [Phytomonospora sp. NPDC050363]|uniref:GAF and ANTAR domain-containing protein n=1 Tax=Phytomonospora sp. NPDC050363 TaxID=3155642 RepID=UPI003403D220